MLLTVLENTRTTTDFYIKTLHMYEARIMKELFGGLSAVNLCRAGQCQLQCREGHLRTKRRAVVDSMCRQSAHLPFYRNFVR